MASEEARLVDQLQIGAYTRVLVLLGQHSSPLGATAASLRQTLRPTVAGALASTSSGQSAFTATPLQSVVATLRHSLSPPMLPLPVHALVPLLAERKQLLRAVTEAVDGCVSGSWEAPLLELNGSFDCAQCDACTRMYEHKWLERVLHGRGLPSCSLCGSLVSPTAFSGSNVVIPNASGVAPSKAAGRHAVWKLLNDDAKQCDLLLCLGVAGQEQAWRRVMSALPGSTPVFLVGCEDGLQEQLERFRRPATTSHLSGDNKHSTVDPYSDDFPDGKVDELVHFADSDLGEGVVGHASQSLVAVGLNTWDRFLADCLFEDEEAALRDGGYASTGAALDGAASTPSTVVAWNRPFSESVHDLIHALGWHDGVAAHLDAAAKKQAARLQAYAAEQASTSAIPSAAALAVVQPQESGDCNGSPPVTSRPLALAECLAPVPEEQQVVYSIQVDGAGVGIFAQASADFDDLDALLAAEKEKVLATKPFAASVVSFGTDSGAAHAGYGVPESKSAEGKEDEAPLADEREWEALMHQLARME